MLNTAKNAIAMAVRNIDIATKIIRQDYELKQLRERIAELEEMVELKQSLLAAYVAEIKRMRNIIRGK